MNINETEEARNERFAADFLGVTVRTLQGWRLRRVGPRYYKVSNLVRYRIKDLEEYLAKRAIEPRDGDADADKQVG